MQEKRYPGGSGKHYGHGTADAAFRRPRAESSDSPSPGPRRHHPVQDAADAGDRRYIYENKNQLEMPNVFAGLLIVILIGLAVENLIFRLIENRTVRRWGMQM